MKQRKKLWKSVLGIILSLALVLSPIPGSSFTVHAAPYENTGDVVIAGVNLNNDTDHTISTEISGVDSGSATLTTGNTPVLTLENFTYEGKSTEYNSYNGFGILCNNDSGTVKIKLNGNNSITINNNTDRSNLFSIYPHPNKRTKLVIEGPGTLNIINNVSCSGDNKGIYSSNDITISGGAVVNITSGASTGGNSIGIEGSTITIDGSTVTCKAGTASSTSCGIRNKAILQNNAKVTAEGGAAASSLGIHLISITDSTLIAKANTGTEGIGVSVASTTSAPMEIVRSTITASGKTYGIGKKELSISSGSNVTASGGTKAIQWSVKNALAGTGWDNEAGSGTGAPISVSDQLQSLSYKKVAFLSHVHRFTYSASDATITATCTNSDGNCGLTNNKVDLTIAKPAKTTYGDSGSASATLTGLSDFNSATGKSVAETAIKYAGRAGTTYAESSTAPTDVGKYTAKITVEGKTASVDYEIGKAKETTPSEAEAKANLNISYPLETISAMTGYEVSSTNSSDTATPISSLSELLNVDSPKVYVRKLSTDDNHVASDWVAVNLVSRPAAPAGLTSESSSAAAAVNGKIKGTTAGMMYSDDNGTTWKQASAGETTVKAGTYLVRYAATESAPAGRSATVTVESREIILADDQKPTAKTDLVSTGKAQALVNEPVAALPPGATEMQYVLGKDDKTAPTDGWSTSVPTGKDEGTYYVWYKAIGDNDHTDSEPKCIVVTIKVGEIYTKVEQKENTPVAEVEGVNRQLAESLLDAEEKKAVDSGENATLTLEITNIDNTVSDADKNLTESKAKEESKDATIGMYLDLSLWLQVGNRAKRSVKTTNGKEITVKAEVPSNLRAPQGIKRTFLIIQIHNSVAKILAKTTSTTIPFKVSEFSTYALAYVDESADTSFYSGLKITQKKGKIKVSWDKTEGIAKYEVFATYCGMDFPKKATKKTKKNSATIKKLKGEKIDFSKNFKLYVVAYDSNGKKIGKTVTAHVAGKDSKKYKNPKEIKLSTKTITLDKGQSSKIKASVKMKSGKGEALNDEHTAKLRYESTNKNVVTVNKKGKVTAVGSGSCNVYVYSRNGLAKKVSVTVN